jgi:hypothetical protein
MGKILDVNSWYMIGSEQSFIIRWTSWEKQHIIVFISITHKTPVYK